MTRNLKLKRKLDPSAVTFPPRDWKEVAPQLVAYQEKRLGVGRQKLFTLNIASYNVLADAYTGRFSGSAHYPNKSFVILQNPHYRINRVILELKEQQRIDGELPDAICF
jgi:hypothetical protein